jgi:hypothetical protein
MSKSDNSKVIIHNRRFWRLFPDGKTERIYMSDKARGHLWQAKGADTQRNPKEQGR